jgi:Xaa-Pro aminopeptidase
MPYRFLETVTRDFEGLKVVDLTEQIDRLVAVKSDEELGLMRQCARMQDAIFEKVLHEIKPGMRDVDVAAMAWREGWVRGSSQGIYLGGSAPMGKPSFLVGRHFQDRTLEEGDNLSFLIEVNGPGGYFTEVGRTIVLGKATQELQDNFAAAMEAQDYSAGLLRPGAACREVAAAHDAFMRARGLPPELRLYSHGQGYDMVERPLVRGDEPMAIEAGMCLAVHPNYELRSLFMIVCDNYVVGPNGTERIHKTERKIFEV